MVCNRCLMIIKRRLNTLDINYACVELGQVTLNSPLNETKFTALKEDLHIIGFELLDDLNSSLITLIKPWPIKYIHGEDRTFMSMKI